jgi:hypothetical protein
MTQQYLRKSQVARRYSVDERTVDRWKLDGRLPAPTYRGRMPLWSENELDASDKAAATAHRNHATA